MGVHTRHTIMYNIHWNHIIMITSCKNLVKKITVRWHIIYNVFLHLCFKDFHVCTSSYAYAQSAVHWYTFHQDDGLSPFLFGLALHSWAIVSKLQVWDGDIDWVVGDSSCWGAESWGVLQFACNGVLHWNGRVSDGNSPKENFWWAPVVTTSEGDVASCRHDIPARNSSAVSRQGCHHKVCRKWANQKTVTV